MPNSWKQALNNYCYPVDLRNYSRASQFSGFFNRNILGDRGSTREFENHYQATAPNNIAAFFEVIYWKLYSQPHRRERITNRIVDFIQTHRIESNQLWNAVQKFVNFPNKANLKEIRRLLELRSPVLAIPITLVAFAHPQKFPMIDNRTAKWINHNLSRHNTNRKNKLSLFNKKFTSLQDDDFPNYLNWVTWCQEVAQVLTKLTREKWRARDVEMVVFTAQEKGVVLNVLP